jgi:hypothetical protein
MKSCYLLSAVGNLALAVPCAFTGGGLPGCGGGGPRWPREGPACWIRCCKPSPTTRGGGVERGGSWFDAPSGAATRRGARQGVGSRGACLSLAGEAGLLMNDDYSSRPAKTAIPDLA